MKERPILFSGEMVRAIMEGRKTQTRRLVKDKRVAVHSKCSVHWCKRGEALFDNPGWHDSERIKCPYGKPGDRLWVRERFADLTGMGFDDFKGNISYYADCTSESLGIAESYGVKWKPSIHMNRKYSRIDLEITNVRVERLQDISEEDAKAEGTSEWYGNKLAECSGGDIKRGFKYAFGELWERINGTESWNKNPWVWVIEFKRI